MAKFPEDSGTPSTPIPTARSRYEQLALERQPYLRRAELAAKLTIPSLLPPENYVGGEDLYEPFQSVGARGVNNLAAKLLLVLFPPGSSFFRLTVDTLVLRQLEAEAAAKGIQLEQARADFEAALSQIETAVVNRMEQKGVRVALFEALKHLLVPGNVLIQVLPGGGIKLHYLNRYVVKRDKTGNVLEIITKETIAKDALPQEVRDFIETNKPVEAAASAGKDTEYDIYTRVRVDPRRKVWRIYQEIDGVKIPGTEGVEPLDKPSFIALRRTKVDGEDYGRGLVEEYLGDLSSLEALNKAIVEFSGAAAKILFFVDESGTTSKEDVARAPSGAVLDGNARDVSTLMLEKFHDFQVANAVAARIEDRLEQAFMLMSSIQRNAERVTAEEIRRMADELEQGLGGLYSILAQELQRPLVDRIMFQMQRDGDLPQLPSGAIEPKIVAGLEGLSRSSDLTKYQIFLSSLQQAFGPEQISQWINLGTYATLLAASLGIDTDGLIRSPEEVQQMQLQAQRQALAERIAPEAMRAAANRVQSNTSQEG